MYPLLAVRQYPFPCPLGVHPAVIAFSSLQPLALQLQRLLACPPRIETSVGMPEDLPLYLQKWVSWALSLMIICVPVVQDCSLGTRHWCKGLVPRLTCGCALIRIPVTSLGQGSRAWPAADFLWIRSFSWLDLRNCTSYNGRRGVQNGISRLWERLRQQLRAGDPGRGTAAGMSRSIWTPGPNSTEVFRPPLKFLDPNMFTLWTLGTAGWSTLLFFGTTVQASYS